MSTPAYSLAQQFTIRPLKSQDTYPIPCGEWGFLKDKISKLNVEPWFWQNVGFLLWGVGLSTLATIIIGTFSAAEGQVTLSLVIAWAVVAVALICGSLSLFFAKAQRDSFKENAREIVAHMTAIEQRYEST